jgi:hypothetical protein
MSRCDIQESGAIELYFYGELTPADHAGFDLHLRGCRECAAALAELRLIRDALAARPEVAAPPSGDWSAFMQRLEASIAHPAAVVLPFPRQSPAQIPILMRRPLTGWLTMAALLALVTLSVFLASRAGRSALDTEVPLEPASVVSADPVGEAIPVASGLRTVGLRHLERSKLVVLGLASKDSAPGPAVDWTYERELASALLADTKLYRMAAEERGLQSLAGVMRDLEIVLLQASMAQEADVTALPQIQRLIRKRSLVEKMDVVGTTGLLP